MGRSDIVNLIKKIIAWILSLIASLFKKKKVVKKKIVVTKEEQQEDKKKSKLTGINGIPDTTLPSYMMISEKEKLELIEKIRKIQKHLIEDNDIVDATAIFYKFVFFESCTYKTFFSVDI